MKLLKLPSQTAHLSWRLWRNRSQIVGHDPTRRLRRQCNKEQFQTMFGMLPTRFRWITFFLSRAHAIPAHQSNDCHTVYQNQWPIDYFWKALLNFSSESMYKIISSVAHHDLTSIERNNNSSASDCDRIWSCNRHLWQKSGCLLAIVIPYMDLHRSVPPRLCPWSRHAPPILLTLN
jgi:hypothetical protein